MERWEGRHNNAQSCQRRRQNPRQKWKNCECAEEQDNESTYSFQNYVSSWYLMFLYQGWYLHKEKDTSFLTLCMANFGLTANSLFEIWTPAWSFARTSRFHKIFFPSLDRMVLFLSSYGPFFFFFFFFFRLSFFFFFFILPRTFFRFWFFHEQRSFHKQRASTMSTKVRDVHKIWK